MWNVPILCHIFLDGLKPPPSFTTYVVFDVPDHLPGLQVSRDQKTLVLFSVYRRLYATQLIRPNISRYYFIRFHQPFAKDPTYPTTEPTSIPHFMYQLPHCKKTNIQLNLNDHSLQETPRIWKERRKKMSPRLKKIANGLRKLQFWGFNVCFPFLALMGVFWKMFFLTWWSNRWWFKTNIGNLGKELGGWLSFFYNHYLVVIC